MTTTQKLQKRLNDSKAMRWSALIIVSLTMMMAYFFTDVMGPLEAPLTTKGKLVYFENGTYMPAASLMEVCPSIANEDEIAVGNTYLTETKVEDGNTKSEALTVSSTIKGLGWSSGDYGIFSGAYGYINVFLLMLFFGGLILDKMGVRFTGVMSTALMFIGAAIKWYAVDNTFSGEMFGLPTQVVIACLGFAIYGMGCEIAGITVTKVIAKWFTGHEMALAMGLQVALARVGTACALFFALPIAQSFGAVSAPVMFGASALCIGLISYIVYCVMDKKLDSSIAADQDAATGSEEQFKFSDLKVIFCNQGFWLITFLCLIFYAAVFPFLKFATNLMIIGSVLLTAVHILFAMPLLNVWWFAVIIMILLGIAFSLVPSAMWPSVPKIIPMKQLGSAYAIIFYIQNIGLSMVPVLIGNVIAANTENGTTDYTMPMSIFALFGAIAVIISTLLKIVDKKKGYGLEKSNIN